MKVHNTHFDLSTLYTSTKDEREKRRQEDRLRYSRLLVHNQQGNEDEGFEVRQAIRDFTRTVDGFVFVIDATKDLDESELYLK